MSLPNDFDFPFSPQLFSSDQEHNHPYLSRKNSFHKSTSLSLEGKLMFPHGPDARKDIV